MPKKNTTITSKPAIVETPAPHVYECPHCHEMRMELRPIPDSPARLRGYCACWPSGALIEIDAKNAGAFRHE